MFYFYQSIYPLYKQDGRTNCNVLLHFINLHAFCSLHPCVHDTNLIVVIKCTFNYNTENLEWSLNTLILYTIGYLCGNCRDGKGVSALLNHCVDCSNAYGILIGVLGKW